MEDIIQMQQQLPQKVFERLQEVLPEWWQKVAFYAGYTAGSFEMKYYVQDKKGEFISCYKLLSDNDNTMLFMDIDEDISLIRDNLIPEKRWNVFTMEFDCDGNVKSDFGYEDISENSINSIQNWEEQYEKSKVNADSLLKVLPQKIYEKLSNYLPKDWQKVAFYAGYRGGAWSMKYFIRSLNGEYSECFKFFDIKDLMSEFRKINDDISLIRENLKPEKRWNVFTMIFDNQGKYKTDLDYTDISENQISYFREWKKKYLV